MDNPFLDLLKEQNLTKIKIDKELIPIFKIVIAKLSDYFLRNNLMSVKDWKSLFHTYLLNNKKTNLSTCFNDDGDDDDENVYYV